MRTISVRCGDSGAQVKRFLVTQTQTFVITAHDAEEALEMVQDRVVEPVTSDYQVEELAEVLARALAGLAG